MTKTKTYMVDYHFLASPTKTQRICFTATNKEDALNQAKIYGYDQLLRIKKITQLTPRKPTRKTQC